MISEKGRTGASACIFLDYIRCVKLDIWSISIIVIALQGIFLLLVLMISKEKRHKAGNRYLLFIILLLIWFLAEFFAVRNKLDVGLTVFYGTRYGSWFLLGPLTYFYFKSVTINGWKFSKHQLWHFLPFVVFVIVIPLIAYKTLNDRQVDYGMLSVFDHREKTLSTIQWTFSIVFVLQFIHLGFFLLKNVKIVNQYSRRLKLEYSAIDAKANWLRNFNITLITILILCGIFLYILLITDIYRRHLDYIYVLPIGVVFYFISFKFMQTDWLPVENRTKYAGSSLNLEEVPVFIARLDKLMTQEKVYLNNVVRLTDLAEKMKLKTHHLSQLINEHYQLSFYDFINKHRLEEAKQLIRNHSEYTLIHIAYESGFNNKTSFINAFKKFEKMTPSKFREAHLLS